MDPAGGVAGKTLTNLRWNPRIGEPRSERVAQAVEAAGRFNSSRQTDPLWDARLLHDRSELGRCGALLLALDCWEEGAFTVCDPDRQEYVAT